MSDTGYFVRIKIAGSEGPPSDWLRDVIVAALAPAGLETDVEVTEVDEP